MSKKNKTSNIKPSSPIKVLLPVIIALVLIIVTCGVIVIIDRPVESAKVNNPNDAFLEIGDLTITNQEMYEALRASGGISNFTFTVDKVILNNIVVTQEDILEAKNEAIYGSEIKNMEESLEELKEELAELPAGEKYDKKQKEITELEEEIAEAKSDAERSFDFNIKSLGYDTEEEQNAYFTVLAKRKVYAKQAYAEYIKNNDFTDKQYVEAYKALDADKYVSSSYVIPVIFQSSNQGNNYLKELFDINTGALSTGWKVAKTEEEKVNIQSQIEAKNTEITTLKAQLATVTDETEKANLEKDLKNAEDALAVLEADLKADNALSDYEIALAFVELYNIINAYYLGGNVNDYFETVTVGEETQTVLKDEYKLLVKDVHYTVDTENQKVEFNHEALVKLAEENENCKFVFTEAEAKSILSTSVTTDLVANVDKDPEKANQTYTYTPTKSGASLYYVAYKYGSYTAPEKDDFTKLADEIAALQKELKDAENAEKQAELDTKLAELNKMRDELRPGLIEDNFNENEQTRLLVELRQKHEVKIYDRFLNASYKAAYEYLYATTLKWKEGTYATYNGDGIKHKELAFSFKDLDGNVVEYTAQKFFEDLKALYAHQAASTMVGDYAFLSNSEYNKIYNPYTGKIYNRTLYKGLLESDYSTIYTELYNGVVNSVQAYKFAFEQGLFATNGFDKEYGWKSFLRDYLLAKDEKELAGNLALDDAEEVYTLSQIKYEEVLAEMQKIYDAYYSVKGLNLIITVDYNYDANPDAYELEEGGVQEYWTEYQISLVEELAEAIYNAREDITGDSYNTLEKKLTEVAKRYNEATYTDATWGKYIKAGLRVKVETAADYKSSASLVQEFHDQMAKYYKEIEANSEYTLGAWTDAQKEAGILFADVFSTSYGFHRVTILNASERIYVDKDKSLDLTKLTLDTYKQYIEDPSQFDETTTTAITTYLQAGLNKVISSNELALLKTDLRLSLLSQVKFADSALLDLYTQYENNYKTYVNELIADEEEEAE